MITHRRIVGGSKATDATQPRTTSWEVGGGVWVLPNTSESLPHAAEKQNPWDVAMPVTLLPVGQRPAESAAEELRVFPLP